MINKLKLTNNMFNYECGQFLSGIISNQYFCDQIVFWIDSYDLNASLKKCFYLTYINKLYENT